MDSICLNQLFLNFSIDIEKHYCITITNSLYDVECTMDVNALINGGNVWVCIIIKGFI